MGSHRTHYDTLGVDREVDADELRRVWKILVQVWHPDRFDGAMREHAETQTACINEAYHVLRDTDRRSAYDRSITVASTTPAPAAKVSAETAPRIDPATAPRESVTARGALAECARAFEEAARCYPRVVDSLSACLVVLLAVGVIHARSTGGRLPVESPAIRAIAPLRSSTVEDDTSSTFPEIDADVAAAQEAAQQAPDIAASEAPPEIGDQARAGTPSGRDRTGMSEPAAVPPQPMPVPPRIIRVMPKQRR